MLASSRLVSLNGLNGLNRLHEAINAALLLLLLVVNRPFWSIKLVILLVLVRSKSWFILVSTV